MSYGRGVITPERGRFRVRVSVRGRYRTIGYYDTQLEAEQMRGAAILVRAEIPRSLTLAEWGEIWLRQTADQRNALDWANKWRNHVLRAPFAHDPIDSITTPEIDRWARDLPTTRVRRSVLRGGRRMTVELPKPISRQTAQHALNLLSRALKAAKRAGYVEHNAADGAQLPRVRTTTKGRAPDYLPAEDVKRLLEHPALSPEQRVVFTVAIFQGLRESEIAALRWQDCDFMAGGWWVVDAKSGAARWQAWLEPTAAALTVWHGLRAKPDRGLVFPARRGRAPIQRGYQARERPYSDGFDWAWADHPGARVTRLGVPRRCGIVTAIPFHGLRDTCATHLLSGTYQEPWDLVHVSKHLGHSDSRVTERRYAHLTPDARRRAALAKGRKGGGGNGSGGAQGPAADLPRPFGDSLASPVGYEPTTFGLGSRSDIAQSSMIPPPKADMRQVCGMVAEQIVAEVAQGRPVEPAVVLRLCAAAVAAGVESELARQVVESRGEAALEMALRLALRVRGACALPAQDRTA